MEQDITIIITCYNVGHNIIECVKSCVYQNYKNYQIIVIDDGSTDQETIESLEYIKHHYLDVQIIRKKNGGVVSARNAGIQSADSEYIVFLDGDDILQKDFLAKTMDTLIQTHSKAAFCITKMFGECNRIFRIALPSYSHLLYANTFPITCLIKREDALRIGGFNDAFVDGYEDWDFWIRFFKPGDKVVRVNEKLFFYRIKKISRNVNAMQMERKLKSDIYFNNRKIYNTYGIKKDVFINNNYYNVWTKIALYIKYMSASFRPYVSYIM